MVERGRCKAGKARKRYQKDTKRRNIDNNLQKKRTDKLEFMPEEHER